MQCEPGAAETLGLNSPELLRRVAELRKTDNYTNWFYLAREYLFLATVVGGTIAFCYWLDSAGLSLLWAVPLALVAIVLVGAGQHRLATLTHEAGHYMLFRNRLLNEFVSEWFCMFPLLGATHPYRVQHLGHHQFPNDPDKDPDLTQLKMSGHLFRFPMTRGRFVWECVVKQFFWLPNPIRYILARAAFVVDMDGPYSLKQKRSPLLPIVAGTPLIALTGLMGWFVWKQESVPMTVLPPAMLAGLLAFYALVPQRFFVQFSIKSDLPPRVQSCLRMTFNTLLITTVAWLTYVTGKPWWLYFIVLWLIPLGTSFSFFMILRQLVQHGNASTERLTNTRIFHVAWPISAAVFPIGNDYHLPHHLFPMVPHYNLRKLHALLMQTDEYRRHATLVEGYFVPRERPPQHPTVVDLMTTRQ
jgi:fatty acid desaturase